MRKFWVVLLALLLASGLVMMSCDDPKEVEVEVERKSTVFSLGPPCMIEMRGATGLDTHSWGWDFGDYGDKTYDAEAFKNAEYLIVRAKGGTELTQMRDVRFTWNSDITGWRVTILSNSAAPIERIPFVRTAAEEIFMVVELKETSFYEETMAEDGFRMLLFSNESGWGLEGFSVLSQLRLYLVSNLSEHDLSFDEDAHTLLRSSHANGPPNSKPEGFGNTYLTKTLPAEVISDMHKAPLFPLAE